MLEWSFIGLYTNWNWLIKKCSFHSRRRVWSDKVSRRNLKNTLVLTFSTHIILFFKWIVSFCYDCMLHYMFETSIHKPTPTAIISHFMRAINQLLFRERNELIIFNRIKSFQRTSSWECPTTPTATLILNWSNSIMISPIPCRWSIHYFKVFYEAGVNSVAL